ncbi:MAG: phospholipase D family protein [Thermoplasmata archaeon]
MSKKPKHWDSWKGKVLRAIIFEKAETWQEVKEKSELTQKQMLKVIRELRRSGKLEYPESKGERRFSILDNELVRAYETFTTRKPPEEDKKPMREHAVWIESWFETAEVNASLNHHHFFLERTDLSDFTRRLMDRARRNILVVNPFVERASLGTSLRDAAKRGVDVVLFTRRPRSDREVWAFHKSLTQEGIDMYYSGGRGGKGGAHSKLVIVDEEVAIVSSMNFTKNSEVYTWETGIVTTDGEVVGSAAESIRGLRDEPETESAKEIHQRS